MSLCSNEPLQEAALLLLHIHEQRPADVGTCVCLKCGCVRLCMYWRLAITKREYGKGRTWESNGERGGERHWASMRGCSTRQPWAGLRCSLTATSVCVQTNRTMSFRLFSGGFGARRGYNGENVDKGVKVQVWQSSAALDPLFCIIVFNLAPWANLLSRTGIPEYDRQKVFTPTEQAVKALCGFQRAVKWKAEFIPGQFQIMRDLEKMSTSIQGIPITLRLLKV